MPQNAPILLKCPATIKKFLLTQIQICQSLSAQYLQQHQEPIFTHTLIRVFPDFVFHISVHGLQNFQHIPKHTTTKQYKYYTSINTICESFIQFSPKTDSDKSHCTKIRLTDKNAHPCYWEI